MWNYFQLCFMNLDDDVNIKLTSYDVIPIDVMFMENNLRFLLMIVMKIIMIYDIIFHITSTKLWNMNFLLDIVYHKTTRIISKNYEMFCRKKNEL